MTLQSSGTIKLTEIVTEYGTAGYPANQRQYLRAGGLVANHQKNESIPTSGTLTTRNLLGTENAFTSDTYGCGVNNGYSGGYGGIAFYQDHIGLPTNSMQVQYYTGTFHGVTVYNGGSPGSVYRVGKGKSNLYKCAFAELADYYDFYYDGDGNYLYSDYRAYFRVYQHVPWSSYYSSINPSYPPSYSNGTDGSPPDSSNFQQYNTGAWWTSITVTTPGSSTTLYRSDCGASGGSGASGINNGSFALWYWPLSSYLWGFGYAGDSCTFKITL